LTLATRAHAYESGFTLIEAAVAAGIGATLLGLAFATIERSQTLARVAETRADVERQAQRAALFMSERLRQSGTDPAAGMALSQPVGGLGLVNEVGSPLGGLGSGAGGVIGGGGASLLGGVTGGLGEAVEEVGDDLGLGADYHHRIAFRMSEGTDPETGATAWGEPRALGFAYEVGEASGGTEIALVGGLLGLDQATPNGVDDDGDGLIDEGLLYYESQVGGATQRELLTRDALPSSGFQLVRAPTSLGANPGGDAVVMRVEAARRFAGRGALAREPHDFVHVLIDTQVMLRNPPPGP
jgi:hypothetical protein